MSAHTTFRIGGPADFFVEVASAAELGALVSAFGAADIPWFALGGGANLLVGDRGIRGVVLDLSSLAWARRDGDKLRAGAGLSVDELCLQALADEQAGLENFYGMPGTLGGALFMNARCYEKDFSETVESIDIISPATGERREARPSPSQWGYKRSPFQPGGEWEGWLIAGATLALKRGDAEGIAATMRARRLDRAAKGHYRLPSAGSMFKNNRDFGKPTGAILDGLGLRGARIGDAGVSPWHANIFVNLGRASAADMRALIEKAQAMAREAYGFALEPEVLFVGEF
ncbi:UDP-N-acetylmuramate dehydrogenase [bacterium]|nr:UDP-N-acetylmuramate dehydrogenase [bacterium]